MQISYILSCSTKIAVLTCSLGLMACAQGGHGIASGDCAVAIGGSSTINVSPELRLSLGDSAIESASRALGNYLITSTGSIGPTETKQATAMAVDAAEHAKGTPLTIAEKRELEDRAQVAIGEYKGRCGK